MSRLGIRALWAGVCLALACLRLAGVADVRFQAVAHLVVGGLVGAWALGRSAERRHAVRVGAGYYGWLALAVTLVEVYAFFAGTHRA